MHSSARVRSDVDFFCLLVQADGHLLVGRGEPAALVDAKQDVGANEVLSLDCLADALVHADRVHWLASPFAAKAIKHWPEGERIHGTANCSAREDRGNDVTDMKEGLWKEKSIETLSLMFGASPELSHCT